MEKRTDLTDARFKKDLPQNTVNRIRNLLHQAGIFTVERWKDSGVTGCYSVRIEIAGTRIGQNGKGITREFALASGYAELMERIQSDYIYVGDMDQELKEYLGFLYSPFEKEFTVQEYQEQYGTLLEPVCERMGTASKTVITTKELLNGLRYGDTLDPSKDFSALPFAELTGNGGQETGADGNFYFPVPLLRDVFVTNGTCAGNSREEALLQGLSEILERNSNIRILTEQMSLPDIPDSYLQKFSAYSMIQDIRSREGCSLLVKDCSFGTGFPVVASILVSRRSHRYMIRFGAHPVFEIALERTLTEMLQGRTFEEAEKASVLTYTPEETNLFDNIHNVLKTASGAYHTNLFAKSRESFREFPDRTEFSIEELYRYTLDLFEQWGLHVYVRDCGFLGFPTYQVVVPGFSEMFHEYGMLRLREKTSLSKAGKILYTLDHADERQLKSLYGYLKFKENFVLENMLSHTLCQPQTLSERQDSLRYICIELCLAVHLGKWQDAINCANRLCMRNSAKEDLCKAVEQVAKCMTAAEGDPADAVDEALSMAELFYPAEVTEKVREMFDWNLCAAKIANDCRRQSFMENEAYRIFRDVKYRLKECCAAWARDSCEML
ncbi:MAG: YcaO-like family protein [Lachnospiraceae bacterium]|nr:YcaO-like family protein [Lachnospiraceae bacterium]